MADLTNNSWNQNDSQNTSAPPNGLPSGSLPTSLYPVIRMIMGALKRFFDRNNNVAVVAMSSNAYTLTYVVAPASYVYGEQYSFVPSATNTGAATININGLGTKALLTNTGGALQANDLIVGASVTIWFDGTSFRVKGLTANPQLYAGTANSFVVGGGSVWTTANFNPANYQSTGDAAAAYANFNVALTYKQANLGYTPVQQGTGNSQNSNAVKIGWSNSSQLRVQVDGSDFGTTWPMNVSGTAVPKRDDGTGMTFTYSGQGGQPAWLWGTNDGGTMLVYNPSNFSVSYAGTAGNANSLGGVGASSYAQLTYSSNQGETVFPIGQQIIAIGGDQNRRALVNLYLSANGIDYTIAPGGTGVTGSWRQCGRVATGVCLYQRVS